MHRTIQLSHVINDYTSFWDLFHFEVKWLVLETKYLSHFDSLVQNKREVLKVTFE